MIERFEEDEVVEIVLRCREDTGDPSAGRVSGSIGSIAPFDVVESCEVVCSRCCCLGVSPPAVTPILTSIPSTSSTPTGCSSIPSGREATCSLNCSFSSDDKIWMPRLYSNAAKRSGRSLIGAVRDRRGAGQELASRGDGGREEEEEVEVGRESKRPLSCSIKSAIDLRSCSFAVVSANVYTSLEPRGLSVQQTREVSEGEGVTYRCRGYILTTSRPLLNPLSQL